MADHRTRGRKSSREVEAQAEALDKDHRQRGIAAKAKRHSGSREIRVWRSENRGKVWERATARPREAEARRTDAEPLS